MKNAEVVTIGHRGSRKTTMPIRGLVVSWNPQLADPDILEVKKTSTKTMTKIWEWNTEYGNWNHQMGIDFALKHFEIIILVGLKSIEINLCCLALKQHTHAHIFEEDWIFWLPTDQVLSQQEME